MLEPGGILGAIADRKRRDVRARLGNIPASELRSRAEPSRRSLAAALAKPGSRFIMEVKRFSPSDHGLRPDADPAALARAYQGAADAISVLVDAPYFGGSYDDLAAVRAVYDGPILAKDFVVDPRQVAEARLAGADAVLAMLSLLEDHEVRTVMAEADALGMEVLVEAHDETEVRRAMALGAPIIGINNRDLRSLRVDLATTESLAGLVPPDRLLVAESGIADRTDVQRLAPLVDAFLVGTALMKAERPAEAARTLAFGRVKVCGLTSATDAQLARAAGASHAGMIFVAGTPRAITIEKARAIREAVGDIPAIGVFRNERLMQVALTANEVGLDAVQLHGEENDAYLKGLRAILPKTIEIWAASSVGEIVPERKQADRLLFDTEVGGRSGGTGKTFDWTRIAARDDLPRAILAGGLKPGNARAAAALETYAIDVGSGVETAPGRKDPAKLAAFFDALRPAARGESACA